MERSVLIERRAEVLVITINRPAARNSVNVEVATGLERALDELEADDSLRVGVLTGAGGYFSAGMDLKAMTAGQWPFTERGGFAGMVERAPAKALIAAIEGFALAGGLEIALTCDLLVAARGAQLGIPEVKRGLVAAGGGLMRLPRRIPYAVAMELALTGASLGAERASSLGLVNRLTAPGEALATALELAGEIAANAPLAVDTSKRILAASRGWSAGEEWSRQGELTAPIFDSEDAREGALSFAEKRPPVWHGR